MTNPETPITAPVAWCRSDDFAHAAQKRQSLAAWREQHPSCDMPLYAQPQTSTAQPTGPSLEEVGTLIAWLGEKAIQAANTGASRDAGMLTWASQVIGERVDEDAPDADQVEGPSLADVDELCAEFGFRMPDDEGRVCSKEVLRGMITAALARWRAPVTEPVATPATQEPDGDRVQKLAAIIREADPARLPRAWSYQFAQALLAHPGFSGCHDGPAALPAQGEVAELIAVPTLLPCPFCGSTDDDLSCDVDEYGRACVVCGNCAAEGPFVVSHIIGSDAAIEQAAAAWNQRSAWQPIETAPRDGTWVLLAGGECEFNEESDNKGRVVTAQWTTEFRSNTRDPLDKEFGCWQFAWYDSGVYGEYENPTHWQPLPSPPPITPSC